MSGMTTSQDRRNLSREAQETMRMSAVQRVLRGERAEEVVKSRLDGH